jgi:hypothetical protein
MMFPRLAAESQRVASQQPQRVASLVSGTNADGLGGFYIIKVVNIRKLIEKYTNGWLTGI